MLDSTFVVHLCYLCLVFVMLSRLFIAVLWSSVGKGPTSWLSFVMFNRVVGTKKTASMEWFFMVPTAHVLTD